MAYDLVLAGQVFAGAQAVSIAARILWGWLSSRAISPRLMLGFIGIGVALSCATTGFYGPDWTLFWVVAVAIAYSATAISFHGVLIAEIARLSPPGEIGATTGAVLSFASAGMLIYPAAFGLFLALSDGYTFGFSLAALPALVVGLLLIRPRRAGPHTRFTGC
jgi:MFS family permease